MSNSQNWYEAVLVRLNRCNSNFTMLAKEAGITRQSFVNWKKNPGMISTRNLQAVWDALRRIEQGSAAPKDLKERKQDLISSLTS